MPSTDRDLDKISLIGAGGFLGVICRFLLCELTEVQLGTLSVNVLGSFMLGLVMYDAEHIGFIGPKGKILSEPDLWSIHNVFDVCSPVSHDAIFSCPGKHQRQSFSYPDWCVHGQRCYKSPFKNRGVKNVPCFEPGHTLFYRRRRFHRGISPIYGFKPGPES